MKKKSCGQIDLCKEASVRDGETLRDHLVDNHPQLFSKESQAMFACTNPLKMCAACEELGEFCIENDCTCNCHA